MPPAARRQRKSTSATPLTLNDEGDRGPIREAFLEQRLGGGEAATPEAYARAIEQWSHLPGAVRGSINAMPPEEAEP